MVLGITVFLADSSAFGLENSDRWRILTQNVIEAQCVQGDGECYINFVAEDEISELNRQYMDKLGSTDVLSFPVSWDVEIVGDLPRILGEIFLCPAVAKRNAFMNKGSMHRGTLDDELALLVVHGVLHLAGMDHVIDEEAMTMESLELEMLSKYYYDVQDI